jgi:predicted nucleic acid-binding protein
VIVFADTCYWIALLNPGDALRDVAMLRTRELSRQGARIVTSEFVLVEVLTFVSGHDARVRTNAAAWVDRIRTASTPEIIPCSSESFWQAVRLYRERPDKQYSHTDCASSNLMRGRGARDALTNDHHFEQEGFRALLKDSP